MLDSKARNIEIMWSAQYSAPGSKTSESFHAIYKVPAGDSPYVKAKHVQLVEKDPERAIALFWAAINAGDRVDSALKDMAIVMKQQHRPEEAIEAIKSLRSRCSDQSQEALDNVLLDLYKRCGRLDDQISLLKQKLHLIHQGLAFNGKRTKTARSQGKKFQVSIEQEASRLLGNLGWAFMQQTNYIAAEAVYRKALSIQPDSNKLCNLGICLMKQGKLQEAKTTLESVPSPEEDPWTTVNSHHKAFERAQEKLQELGALQCVGSPKATSRKSLEIFPGEDGDHNRDDSSWNPMSPTSLGTGILAATSGFGPLKSHLQRPGTEEVSSDEDQEDSRSRSRKKRTQYRGCDSSIWSFSSFESSPEASKLPLTSDWTNKAREITTPVGGFKAPGAKRVLKPEFDELEFRDSSENRSILHLLENEGVQRRLKVFEDITLPASS